MLPRIEARDSLLWASRVAAGAGQMRQADRAALLRAWRKQAGDGPGESVRTPAGLMGALAAAGVPVRVVKREPVTRHRAKPA